MSKAGHCDTKLSTRALHQDRTFPTCHMGIAREWDWICSSGTKIWMGIALREWEWNGNEKHIKSSRRLRAVGLLCYPVANWQNLKLHSKLYYLLIGVAGIFPGGALSFVLKIWWGALTTYPSKLSPHFSVLGLRGAAYGMNCLRGARAPPGYACDYTISDHDAVCSQLVLCLLYTSPSPRD